MPNRVVMYRMVLLSFFLLVQPATSSASVAIDAVAGKVRDWTDRTYRELLYEIGKYVRSTWTSKNDLVLRPSDITRVSDDVLATAVRPEIDVGYFSDETADRHPEKWPIPFFENRIALAEHVMERVRPILIKSVCGKGGLLGELDDIKLKELAIAVATALGFGVATGTSVTVPVVVIAVTAILVKAGIREYCSTAIIPQIATINIELQSTNQADPIEVALRST